MNKETTTLVSIIVLFLTIVLPRIGINIEQTEIQSTIVALVQVITTIIAWGGYTKATNRSLGGFKK